MIAAAQVPEPEPPSASPSRLAAAVPRWEWRTFERTFAMTPGVEPTASAASEQTYILSLHSPHSVKIRDGQLTVKRLERVDERGIHLWRPVLQAAFPIGVDELGVACDAWGIPRPAPGTPPHSLSDLLRNVVVGHRALRIVTLTKRRMRISVGPCQGERGQIVIGRHRWNTLSFEDTDPNRVIDTLDGLGLSPVDNEDYPSALKRILGFPDHSSTPHALSLH
ncbi:MAG TPA: hypothetical protein VFT41_09765 [Gemmatimonadaceae bacterium]|nr:hypothetical protein [Gemmatimonadaceae bacterium]